MSMIDRQFWDLVAEVNRVDEASLNTPDQEPQLLRLLELLRAHPNERPLFVGSLRALALGEREASWEIVPFLMHSLRYPEILEAVQNAIDAGRDEFHRTHDLRHWTLLYDVRDSYKDEWEHASIWRFYAEESTRRIAWWHRLPGLRHLTRRCS